MVSVRKLSSLREREAPAAPVRTLAVIGLAGGLSCLFAATFPATPGAPVVLLRVLGVPLLFATAAIWLWAIACLNGGCRSAC